MQRINGLGRCLTRYMSAMMLWLSLSVILLVAMPGTVIAWDLSCVTDRVCIYKDSDYGVPMAATSGSDGNYVGDYYPNTRDPINDSVSSLKNYYRSRDVVFFHDVWATGSAFCVDSYWQYSWVGLLNNDRFSSHVVTVDDLAC